MAVRSGVASLATQKMAPHCLQDLSAAAARGLRISETRRKAAQVAGAAGRNCGEELWLTVWGGSSRCCHDSPHFSRQVEIPWWSIVGRMELTHPNLRGWKEKPGVRQMPSPGVGAGDGGTCPRQTLYLWRPLTLSLSWSDLLIYT